MIPPASRGDSSQDDALLTSTSRTRRTPAQCSAASQIVAEPPQTLPRTPRAPGEGRAAGRWPTSTINATPARAESPPSTSFTAEIPPRSTLLTTLASTRSPVPIAHAPSAARTRKGEREERVLAVAATAATSSFSSSGATALPGREWNPATPPSFSTSALGTECAWQWSIRPLASLRLPPNFPRISASTISLPQAQSRPASYIPHAPDRSILPMPSPCRLATTKLMISTSISPPQWPQTLVLPNLTWSSLTELAPRTHQLCSGAATIPTNAIARFTPNQLERRRRLPRRHRPSPPSPRNRMLRPPQRRCLLRLPHRRCLIYPPHRR